MNTWGRKHLIQSKKYSAPGRKTFWGKLTVILKVQSAAYKEVTQLEY